jgi:hypothetical protein
VPSRRFGPQLRTGLGRSVLAEVYLTLVCPTLIMAPNEPQVLAVCAKFCPSREERVVAKIIAVQASAQFQLN